MRHEACVFFFCSALCYLMFDLIPKLWQNQPRNFSNYFLNDLTRKSTRRLAYLKCTVSIAMFNCTHVIILEVSPRIALGSHLEN